MTTTKSKVYQLAKADGDPKKAILDALGDIRAFDVAGQSLLVAIYIEPQKTAGGVFLPESRAKESRYQGKVGLVVKRGPAAFLDDGATKFYGWEADVGDWVMFRPSDGWEIDVHGVCCRMIDDTLIRAKIPRPDFVW